MVWGYTSASQGQDEKEASLSSGFFGSYKLLKELIGYSQVSIGMDSADVFYTRVTTIVANYT